MDDYATALTGQNRMLGELLQDADWSAPVPTCPGWTLLQLLRHVGRGDRWAAQIIADRADASLDPRLVREGRPPADAPGAIQWLSRSPLTLLAAVDDVGPGTEVSTFLGPRAASWWVRRRLHEATVHRADAAIALGALMSWRPDSLLTVSRSGSNGLLTSRPWASRPHCPPGQAWRSGRLTRN